jgi:hypothetical protein
MPFQFNPCLNKILLNFQIIRYHPNSKLIRIGVKLLILYQLISYQIARGD